MSDTKTRYIAILPADPTSIKVFFENEDKRIENSKNNVYWIFLGKDVPLSLFLNDLIGMKAQRLDIADSLQTIANNARQDYIDYVGRMGASERTRFWWLTSISEKNPFISNVFLYSCYLEVVADIYKKKTFQNLVIICESPALMTAIDTFLKETEDIHVDYNPSRPVMKDLLNGILRLRSTAIFLVRWTGRCVLAYLFSVSRIFQKKSFAHEGEIILIHSWTDHRSFQTPGMYEDVFLGRLGSDLKKIHPGVWYLIDVLPTCFFPVALSRLMGMREDFLVMEEFINPLDILLSVYSVSAHFPKPTEIPRFRDMDIAPIVYEELEADRRNLRAFQTYLNYLVGQKISKNCSVRSFIYSFENLMWEKLFCLSFREFSPDTAIIGYAHSTISKMETFYSVSSYERDFLPLPDMVVVNGVRAQDVLINSGFDHNRVIIGGAYRYHSLDVTSPVSPKKRGIKNILIIPTDDINSTLELVTKTIHAFGNKEEISCIVKLHPTFPKRKISAFLSQIPGNFIVSDKPVDYLLSCVDLVVYTGSTVAVEALARGIPILHVRSDLTIDRDIFNESDHIVSVSRPEEMYQAFLTISREGFESQKTGKAFVQEFFAPIDGSAISVFLGKNH
ncbi:hypothetical protein [Methanoregula sp.]|jgi:hypothetical protein|uniref:hypothetical protein n=1 Tax=Methanoregula sp. TaxID=2052170 RepID=UPI003C2A2B8D